MSNFVAKMQCPWEEYLEKLPTTYPHVQIDCIERQAHTYRCNTMPMIKPISDAVHIGRGSQLMCLLIRDLVNSDWHPVIIDSWVELSFVLLQAYVFHDIGESTTGDVLSDFKRAIPAIQEVEDQVVIRQFGVNPSHVPVSEALRTSALVESLVKAVDLGECLVTCTTEWELGNKRILRWILSGNQQLKKVLGSLRNLGISSIPSMDHIVTRADHILMTAHVGGWRE